MLNRVIYLGGMMGTGKSSLGKAVAERAGVPFIDLDEEIAKRAGMSVRQIFERDGEGAFRAREHELLNEQLAEQAPRVVALGGGALLSRPVRLRALQRGVVISLTASVPELLRRLAGDRSRPVLSAGFEMGESRVRDLLDARAAVYAEAHATLDTTSRSLDELAGEVLRIAALDAIPVALGERTYTVDIVPGALAAHLGPAIDGLRPTRIVHVTNDVVGPLLSKTLSPVWKSRGEPVEVVLPDGEPQKTLASVERILRAAVDAPVDRGAVVVGVGGGVITDIAGLAAALTLRGLRWIAVPTTILSMVDASVGGKTAVDLGAAKNAVGAFHQPSRVLVDPELSRTEAPRAVRGGLAEAVKTALIGDAALYQELVAPGGVEQLMDRDHPEALARAIRSSIGVKAAVVSRDERESGERAHLNLGHTVGHALEAEGGFVRLTHGEAVSLGMVAALRVGVAMGVTPRPLAREIISVLARLGLPVDLDAEPLTAALRWVAYDKKRQGDAIRFILVRAPGAVEITKISAAQLPGLLAPL